MLHLQSLIKLTLGFTISALLLTACGGDAPPATAENQAVDNEPTVAFLATDAPTLQPTITPSPNLPPPTAIPLEVQLGDLAAGEYTLSMVGALNSDIGFTPLDTGMTGADYDLALNGTNLDGPFEFSLWTDILTDGTTDDTTARIIFTLPASITEGTHEVVGLDAMTANDIGVEVITGQSSQRFGASATGTINIVANGGAGGVFSGEFEVSVGDDAGNTILANGRASAIGFTPEESAELIISGAINVVPQPQEISYTLAKDNSTAANNDWRLEVAVVNNETNPYVVIHRIYMTPNIALGTYDILPRKSELDARPNDLDAVAYIEIIDTSAGTRGSATEISGTLEVIDIRDSFTATFTLTYKTPEFETTNEDGETVIIGGEEVTAEGGVFYLFKPAE